MRFSRLAIADETLTQPASHGALTPACGWYEKCPLFPGHRNGRATATNSGPAEGAGDMTTDPPRKNTKRRRVVKADSGQSRRSEPTRVICSLEDLRAEIAD